MLKNFFALFLAVLSLFFIHIKTQSPIFEDYAENFEICLEQGSFSSKIFSVDAREFAFYSGIKGESCKLTKADFNLKELLDNFDAKIVMQEDLQNCVCYYAFSPKIKYIESIKGRRVNLHVAVSKDSVTIGAPLIYGSF